MLKSTTSNCKQRNETKQEKNRKPKTDILLMKLGISTVKKCEPILLIFGVYIRYAYGTKPSVFGVGGPMGWVDFTPKLALPKELPIYYSFWTISLRKKNL